MKKGFTLIELLVVISILLLMAIILFGSLNPIVLVNRARDARRKKDLSRIKVAFEEYYNDRGCYPNEEMVALLTNPANCNQEIVGFSWLKPWPCDPNKVPYEILTGYDTDCPKWYKILTSLEYKKDKDITADWLFEGSLTVGSTDVNYGVSSGNISVGDYTGGDDPYCLSYGECYYYPEPNKCNKVDMGCSGSNCYLGECSTRCKVSCCGAGCN